MTILPLLGVIFVMKIVAVLFVISAIALILIVLIQKGKGGGLSAAFGGGGGGGLMGSKTGDFLTWVTIVIVAMFLGLGVIMVKFYKPTVSEFGTEPAATQQPGTAEQPTATEQLDETEQPAEAQQPAENAEEPVAPVQQGTDANSAAQ